MTAGRLSRFGVLKAPTAIFLFSAVSIISFNVTSTGISTFLFMLCINLFLFYLLPDKIYIEVCSFYFEFVRICAKI